jgi:hypothetical protein
LIKIILEINYSFLIAFFIKIFLRKWREDYARLLQEKDQRETVQMEDLRNQAKKELNDW